MTKKLDFSIINGATVFNRVITVDKKDVNNLGTLVGTVLNQFFDKVDLQTNGHVKGLFKFSKPFEVVIKFDGQIIDTRKYDTMLKTNFKLNKTADKQKKFAKAIFALIKSETKKVEVVSLESVIESRQ